MKKEIWKPIKGFEQRYEISNKGRIYSKIRNRIKKQTTQKNGYNYVMLCYGNGDFKCCSVHRLVATHFIKNPENKPQVHHINHIKVDNRVSNLMFVSGKENIAFAFEANICKKSLYGSSLDGFSIKEYKAQYYQKNKEKYIKNKAQKKHYYQKHRDKILAHKKQKYHQNKLNHEVCFYNFHKGQN